MKVAVLDLGSTSFRLVIARGDTDGAIVPLLKKRAPLNLGLVLGREGEIPEPHATAAVDAVTRLLGDAERANADRLVVVATSALRDAANRYDLAARLEVAAGRPVRFLSGREEAGFTFAAIKMGLELENEPVLTADLGGGSLELAIGDSRSLAWTQSLAMGSSRLTGMFVHRDPIGPDERERMTRHVRSGIREISLKTVGLVVVAGGTVKAVARLVAGERRAAGTPVHGMTIAARELERVSDRLLSRKRSKRLLMEGMRPDRVDVLGAGTLVLATLVASTGLGALTVSEWGLREGIILEALGALHGREPTLASGAELARLG